MLSLGTPGWPSHLFSQWLENRLAFLTAAAFPGLLTSPAARHHFPKRVRLFSTGIGAHTCNASTWETESGGLRDGNHTRFTVSKQQHCDQQENTGFSIALVVPVFHPGQRQTHKGSSCSMLAFSIGTSLLYNPWKHTVGCIGVTTALVVSCFWISH